MRTTMYPAELKRMADGMADALHLRMNPRAKVGDAAQIYRSMSLLEMAREFLEGHGQDVRGASRFELASRALSMQTRGMLGTSEFPSLLANAAGKRLREAYDENVASYRLWARQAPGARDFRPMKAVQLSAAPDLLQTNEHGEFRYGTMSDGAETYSVVTYGRIVSLTRQALINDDLRGFDRLISAFAGSARRLENRLVYAQLTANGALSDGVALFHATHANLGTGAGSALDLTSLAAGRAAMRKQKGLQTEELNLAPAFLIVPAALEQTAYQYTSANYTPATPGNVSEFRTGGKTALQPVVEPLLDASSATAWYLAANPSQVDTVEYCYLEGQDGPVMESENSFDVDGISFKCRLDFAAKAIDHRGLYRGDGA